MKRQLGHRKGREKGSGINARDGSKKGRMVNIEKRIVITREL